MTNLEYITEIATRIERIKSILPKNPPKVWLEQDPTNTHIVAGVLSSKEINHIFRSLPWCMFLNMRGQVIIRRDVWESISEEDRVRMYAKE